MSVRNNLDGLLDGLDGAVELALAHADLADNHENLAVAFVSLPHDLLVHFVRLFEQTQRIFKVASLHVASSQQGQDVGVVLLGGFDLRKETAVKLQGGRQVVKCLFKVGCA